MNIFLDLLKNFLQMGGYAAYVWSAYGLVLIVLSANIVFARRYFKRVVKKARRQGK